MICVTTEKLRQLARVNLEVIPLSFNTIIHLEVSDISNLDYKGLHHIMTCIENTLIDQASSRLKFDPFPYTTTYTSAIEKCVNLYEAAVKTKFSKTNQTSLETIELHSQELLMKWTAFCLVHKYVTSKNSFLSHYGVPLKSSNLQHLVLSDKRQIETMIIVASYLDYNTEHDGEEIFSLLPTDQTFNMLKIFGETINPSLRLKWESEKTIAGKRIADHWKIITEKKEQCKKLRNSIENLRSEEADLRASLLSVEVPYYSAEYTSISRNIRFTVRSKDKKY